jgi:hypothetical protein
MLVVTKSDIATRRKRPLISGMFESRSGLEKFLFRRVEGLKPLPGSLRVPAILLLQHL